MKTIRDFGLGLAIFAGLMLGTARASDVGGSPDRGFGVGAMLGEPTGMSLKCWISEKSAIDGGLGWSFSGHDGFQMHADYLYHLFELIPVQRNRLPLYIGGGVRYKFRDHRDDLFGFRAVVGVSYLFDDLPLDIFGEAGPILDITPDVKAHFAVAVGARFWF